MVESGTLVFVLAQGVSDVEAGAPAAAQEFLQRATQYGPVEHVYAREDPAG